MARTQTMVQLSDELVARLDAEASIKGVSRSALIRSILTTHLATESEAAKVARYVESYRRRPQPTIDEWGNLEAHGESETRRMVRELDAEDKAAGSAW